MPQKPIQIVCPSCLCAFYRRPSDIERAISKSRVWRCQTCTLRIRNRTSARAQGTKRTTKKGYVQVKVGRKWVFEHRKVMELCIGRALFDYEVVHHKDGDKANNSISNLELLTKGNHSVLHNTGRTFSSKTRDMIRQKARNRHIPQKLTEQKVRDIRRKYNDGQISFRALAKEYAVTPRAIVCVIKGITWRHIDA